MTLFLCAYLVVSTIFFCARAMTEMDWLLEETDRIGFLPVLGASTVVMLSLLPYVVWREIRMFVARITA